MAAAGVIEGGRDAAKVSTSSRTSKTWVLPPRPKPGRKSKKATAEQAAAAPGSGQEATATATASPDDNLDEAELEKAISRTKQKASRERKQEYIAELEAKVRLYESGEGEKAAFFQALAKKYLEENEHLRAETEQLKSLVGDLQGQLRRFIADHPHLDHHPTGGSNASAARATYAASEAQDSKSKQRRPSGSSTPSLVHQRAAKRQRTRSASASSNASTASATTAAIFLPSSAQIDPLPLRNSPSPQAPSSAHRRASTPYSSLAPHARPAPPSLATEAEIDASPSGVARQKVHSGSCGMCDKDKSGDCVCEDLQLSPEEKPSYHSASIIVSSSQPNKAHQAAKDGCGFCETGGASHCFCAELNITLTPKSKLNPLPPMLPPSSASAGRDVRKPAGASSTQEKPSCGLCSGNNDCLCEDMGLGRPTSANDVRSGSHLASGSYISAISDTATSSAHRLVAQQTSSTMQAVPLRRRTQPAGPTTAGKVWRLDNVLPSGPKIQAVTNPAAAAASVALRRRLIKVGTRLPCTGDPKTCPACADDPAGQAFCSALSNTLCSTNPCATCPNRPSPLAREIVTSSTSLPAIDSPGIALKRQDSSARDEVPAAMVPCSDAWATLREHPNIGFANLDLLANVVARRTRCLGMSTSTKAEATLETSASAGADGKIVRVDPEGIQEALDLLDHVRDDE